MSWTRRTIKNKTLPVAVATAPEERYVCPTCSTRLYEECGTCHAVRHSLLPSCQACRAVTPI
jgi:hypothetical protein